MAVFFYDQDFDGNFIKRENVEELSEEEKEIAQEVFDLTKDIDTKDLKSYLTKEGTPCAVAHNIGNENLDNREIYAYYKDIDLDEDLATLVDSLEMLE